MSLSLVLLNRHVLPPRTPFSQPVDPRLDESPAQESGGEDEEDDDDGLVLDGVALEAGREDIFFTGVFADRQVIVETEGAGAVGAGELVLMLLRRSWRILVPVGKKADVLAFRGGRRRGRRVESNDGAIVEADAFAEGSRRIAGSVRGRDDDQEDGQEQ